MHYASAVKADLPISSAVGSIICGISASVTYPLCLLGFPGNLTYRGTRRFPSRSEYMWSGPPSPSSSP